VATLQQISDFMAESFRQSKVSIEAVDADSALYVAIFGPRHRASSRLP